MASRARPARQQLHGQYGRRAVPGVPGRRWHVRGAARAVLLRPVRKLERNLAHAEEEAEVCWFRDEMMFHKVTKIGAFLESVPGRDAQEVREQLLAQMGQNYSSLQRATTTSITRANSLLAHLDHLRDTSRASAISDSALQEQLAQARARLETATAVTAHATAEAAAAT